MVLNQTFNSQKPKTQSQKNPKPSFPSLDSQIPNMPPKESRESKIAREIKREQEERDRKIANAIQNFDGKTFLPYQIGEDLSNRQVDDLVDELELRDQPWILHLNYRNGDRKSLPLYYSSHATLILRAIFKKTWSQGFVRNELPSIIRDSAHWSFDNEDPFLAISSVSFEAYKDRAKHYNRNAAFYPFRHTCPELATILDKHQIFFKGHERPENEDHCLLQSLRNAGISEEKLLICREHLRGSKCFVNTTKPQIDRIGELLGIKILICTVEKKKDGVSRCRRNYRKKDCSLNPQLPHIELTLIDRHLMFNEKLPQISVNYIAHRERIIKQKGLSDPYLLQYCRNIENGDFCRDTRESTMTLYKLITQMSKHGYIDEWEADICPVFPKVDMKNVQLTQEIIDLSYGKKKAEEVGEDKEEEEVKEEKEMKVKPLPLKPKEIYFASDFETFVNETRHRACLAGIVQLRSLDELKSSEPQDYVKTDTKDFAYLFRNYSLLKPDEGEEESEEQSDTIVIRLMRKLGNEIRFKKDQKGKIVQTVLPVCFFHNLRYDANVFLQDCGYKIKNIVRRGGTFYSMQVFHDDEERLFVEFRDSSKLFGPGSLSKCPEKFQLPKHLVKKEAINYKYYTRSKRNTLISVEEYSRSKSFDSEESRQSFNLRVLENLQECKECAMFDEEKQLFNPWRYYEYYLMFDVIVLAASLMVYQRDFRSLAEIDPLQSLSVSSLISKVCHKNGCFEGVLPVKNILRKFLQQSVYGGRVWVNPLYEGKVVEGKFQYLDAVSLYPSAMVKISQEMGLPTGRAKLLQPGENPFLYPHFTVQIRITAARKSQASGIQFICKRPTKSSEECEVEEEEEEEEEEEGLRYVGEFDFARGDDPIVCVVDRVTLEDYIEFHEIEYVILQGVYWDGPVNRLWGDEIQKWFDLRLRHKRSGNKGMDGLLKLSLNSSYGKTIMRSVDEQNVYKNQSNYKTFLADNFLTIKNFQNVGQESVEFTTERTDESSALVQAGSLVLSMSKRIMNRVMNCLSDLKSPIYYTDTDSMCINDAIIPQLESLYDDRYPGLPLIGESLGQFHSDFSVSGCRSDNIYSKRAYFIGKKMYLHVLEAKDNKNDVVEWYKMSFKGITQPSLHHLAKEFDEAKTTVGGESIYLRGLEAVFQKMVDGEALRALQNPPGEKNDIFLYSKGCVGIQTSSNPFYKSIGTKRAVKELNSELKNIRKAVTQVIGSNKKQRID